MNALIIEDEPRAASQLKKLIDESGIEIQISGVANSVESAKAWFLKNPLPDLIFSDIQLGDGTVFEVYQNMKKLPPVIFTTAFNDYALNAFKANGIDYLLKPIDPDELKVAIKKYLSFTTPSRSIDLSLIANALQKETKSYKTRFMVRVGEKLISIRSESIICIYSLMKSTFIRTREHRNYAIDYTLDQLEQTLNPSHFFRVNRKIIVHFEGLDTIHTWSGSRLKIELITDLEDDIVVSRDRVREFKAWLDR